MESLDPLILELQKIRDEKQLSYRQLASEIGVHYLTVFKWFKGGKVSNLSKKAIKQYLISML